MDRYRALRFGMWIFIVTVGRVFLSTILAYVIVRLQLLHKVDKPWSVFLGELDL